MAKNRKPKRIKKEPERESKWGWHEVRGVGASTPRLVSVRAAGGIIKGLPPVENPVPPSGPPHLVVSLQVIFGLVGPPQAIISGECLSTRINTGVAGDFTWLTDCTISKAGPPPPPEKFRSGFFLVLRTATERIFFFNPYLEDYELNELTPPNYLVWGGQVDHFWPIWPFAFAASPSDSFLFFSPHPFRLKWYSFDACDACDANPGSMRVQVRRSASQRPLLRRRESAILCPRTLENPIFSASSS